jgi:thioredoxin reductase
MIDETANKFKLNRTPGMKIKCAYSVLMWGKNKKKSKYKYEHCYKGKQTENEYEQDGDYEDFKEATQNCQNKSY